MQKPPSTAAKSIPTGSYSTKGESSQRVRMTPKKRGREDTSSHKLKRKSLDASKSISPKQRYY